MIYWFQVRPARTLPNYNLYQNLNANYELLYLEPFTPLGASIEITKNKLYFPLSLPYKRKHQGEDFFEGYRFAIYLKTQKGSKVVI